MAFAPAHPSEAVQLVALVLDQVSVAALPPVIVVGFAVSVSTGKKMESTVTVTDCAAEPPEPVQVSV